MWSTLGGSTPLGTEFGSGLVHTISYEVYFKDLLSVGILSGSLLSRATELGSGLVHTLSSAMGVYIRDV
jgi:hypothetical protein